MIALLFQLLSKYWWIGTLLISWLCWRKIKKLWPFVDKAITVASAIDRIDGKNDGTFTPRDR
jgi:predicted tellurium resistance membrane protein TerC